MGDDAQAEAAKPATEDMMWLDFSDEVKGSRNRKGKKGKGTASKGNPGKGKGGKGIAPKPYWARSGGGGKGGKGYKSGGGKGGGGKGGGGSWKHGFAMEGKRDAHGGRYVEGGYVDWSGQFYPHLDDVEPCFALGFWVKVACIVHVMSSWVAFVSLLFGLLLFIRFVPFVANSLCPSEIWLWADAQPHASGMAPPRAEARGEAVELG